MLKTKKRLLFLILIIFSTYCAISIGYSWDEGFLIRQGQITANYLLSLGLVEPDNLFRREFYSPVYYSIRYLLVQAFPVSFQLEAGYLFNMAFSITAIVGIKKICEELFNKEIGIIVFLILFFFPAFFGHMGFNSKDTIVAFCNVWIFLLALRYIRLNKSKYIYYIGLLAAVGTGLNLFFLGSLVPLILFFFIEIFLFKKISHKKISVRKISFDIFKGFIIFYFTLILFWIDTHSNILILPFKLIYEWTFSGLWRGYPYILVNGEYFFYSDIPKSYLFINLIYKSPEYFLIAYPIFFIIFITARSFFTKRIKNFNYSLLLILSMALYPFLLLYLTPFSIYDGLRHVLWMIPYICVIPGLVIFYFLKNIKLLKIKFISSLMFLLICFFSFSFFTITPYQYTYLNFFSGKKENNYKKFENDYWGGSIKELIKSLDLPKNTKLKMATCGVSTAVPKYYLKKNGYKNFKIGHYKESDYIIMTNRVILDQEDKKKLTNCFDKFQGENLYYVYRNGAVLSVIRKIN